ncbi:MAG: protein kinase domain-containing protein, partial [Rudaea sp.]
MSVDYYSAVAFKGAVAHVDGIPYRVEAIKRGGMGVVYLLARCDGSDSVVYQKRIAAKIFDELSEGLQPDAVRRELTNWLSLKHPHIVELLALGDLNFHLAALMPVAIGSIEDARCVGPIPIAAATEISRQALRGLHYAWSQHRLLHLDIKPGNLLTFENAAGRKQVRVSDWGMSAVGSSSSGSLARQRGQGGTLAYMAPERFFREMEETPASDIFSLGITLIQLATNRLPFDPEGDIASQIVSGAFVRRAATILRGIGLH